MTRSLLRSEATDLDTWDTGGRSGNNNTLVLHTPLFIGQCRNNILSSVSTPVGCRGPEAGAGEAAVGGRGEAALPVSARSHQVIILPVILISSSGHQELGIRHRPGDRLPAHQGRGRGRGTGANQRPVSCQSRDPFRPIRGPGAEAAGLGRGCGQRGAQ